MENNIRPCRVCGVPIQFVPTGEKKPDGKPVLIPLDQRAPVYDIDANGNARKIHGFVTHFATCKGVAKIKAEQKKRVEAQQTLHGEEATASQ